MNWENFYTALVTIERNKDGSFKRENGQKKVVFLEHWKEATRKTQAEINKHFENFNAALALLTGKKNGITVIDFDTKTNDLIMELFIAAPTKTVETEKGIHFYYRYCPEFYTKANAFGAGVDCRNDGGVVFCPPTPNYIPKDDPIQELTPEGIELLKAHATGKKRIDLVNTTTRNDDLFRRACGWVEHYDKEEVWRRMVKANVNFHKGELDDDELETIYQQAIKYHKTGQKPEDVESYQLKTLADVSEDVSGEPRFTTGFSQLDAVMMDDDLFGSGKQGGLAIGEFLAIAGRPGSGKTLTAAQITQAVQSGGIRTMWFSYEIKLKKLKKILRRLGADLSMVNAVDVTSHAPLLGNINWLEEYIKLSKELYGTQMVVIDNLDFLETRNDRDANYSMNQQAFLHSIVSELSKMALQYEVILILIAHVRKPDNKLVKPKRPYLYDIAGTSAVERLCHFGLIIDREEIDGEQTNFSKIYLDKNRLGGVRKAIDVQYQDGKLAELTPELVEIREEMARKKADQWN